MEVDRHPPAPSRTGSPLLVLLLVAAVGTLGWSLLQRRAENRHGEGAQGRTVAARGDLTDLETTGAFREPRSSRDAVTALADLVSPTSAFVRDRCKVDADGRVPVTDLYAAWRGWAQDNGHAVGSVQNFGIRLRAVVPTVRVVRSRDGESRSREYEGLRLLVPADPDEDGRGGPAHDDQGRGPRGPEGAPQGRSGPQGPRSEPLWNRPNPVSDPRDPERATDDDGELDESVRP
jgi:hypothetical protein